MANNGLQTLNGLGWKWHDNGAIITVRTVDELGAPASVPVFVPLDRIWAAFSKHLGSVGCPFPAGVGAPFSVGSLFSWVKKATKDVGHAVGSAGHELEHVANKYGGHAIGKLGKEAMESKTFRGVVDVAAIAVPALAPAAAGLETAHQIYDKVELGKHAAHAIAQGHHTPENHAAVIDAHEHLNALGEIIDLAHQGHPEAQEVIGGLHIIQGLPLPPPSPLTPPLPPHHPHHKHHHHMHPGVPAPPVAAEAPPYMGGPPPVEAPPYMPPVAEAPPFMGGPPPPPPGHPHHHRHHHGHPGAAPGVFPGGPAVGPVSPPPGWAVNAGYHWDPSHAYHGGRPPEVPFHPLMHHGFTPAHATQLHRFLAQNYPHLKTVPIR